MKVAVDISPLKTGHKVRGIGSYTEKLTSEFKKNQWGIEFEFFSKSTSPPPADVIHYPYFDLFFHTLPLKKTIARGVTIHDVIPLLFPNYFPAGIKGYINLFFQKKALKNTDFVICDSQASKNDICQKLSYPQDRIKVIYLAPGQNFKKNSDRKKLEVTAKRFNLPKNFVLYVGDVNWNKNLPALIEAVKIAKINLVMVGQAIRDQNLAQTKQINSLIKKLKLENQIIKTGYIKEEDLVDIYNLANVTVLPSFHEGFGLPILESLACGTPVVCSEVASLVEIAAGVAFFCDPASPDDIAQKVTRVLNLPEKVRLEITKRSIRHASKFSWQKVAQETVKVYKEIMGVS